MYKTEKEAIEAELNDLYNFTSAEENEGFAFSLSQSYDRIDELEKKLKAIKEREIVNK
jgi:hypothetical protein